MVDVQMDVKVRGPLFDGRAAAAVDDYVLAAEEAVADEGVNDVRYELDRVLRNPTGYYESRVQTERQGDDYVVNDGGVIYGPWLAGTSSRNQTTSFKGYDHWRLATQRLQDKAQRIAERELPPFLARMQ